jgi:hypothetical protein
MILFGLNNSKLICKFFIFLDGRNIKVKNYEKGNFIGPTVLADVQVIYYC